MPSRRRERRTGSESRKVLWVNSIGLRKPRLAASDLARAVNKVFSRRAAGGAVDPACQRDFTVLNPKTIPAPTNRVERSIARGLLRRQLQPAIREAGLHEPILWISLPTAVDLVGELGEAATVYYCGDDFSALAGVDHVTVAARERELSAKADLVITASEVLAGRFPAPKTRLLSHGVDYRLFSTPCPRAADFPANGKPVAGFYGSISEWLDIELLVETIRRMPHWDFVFIGTASVDLSALKSLANVYLPGPRPHAELPGYSQHWEVSLLPFRDNEQIRACNPLKLSEYLAAGKPIVSTPFPALEAYSGLVSTVRSAEDMVAAIEGSRSAAACSEHAHKLRSSVAHLSWQARAERVSDWLEAI